MCYLRFNMRIDLVPSNLAELIYSESVCVCKFLKIFYYIQEHVIGRPGVLLLSQSGFILFLFLSYVLCLEPPVLSRSLESRDPCPVLDLKG